MKIKFSFKKIQRYFLNFLGNSYFSMKPMFYFYHPEFHKVKGYEIRQILDKIQPGDLIFRNFDGYLSSVGIPGFWSHVGIYIGNNMVIHAIGEGVITEDILDFCRTDHVALKRIKIKKDVKQAIEMAEMLCLTRTKYDYDFKDNNGKIYCSELIDICYNGIFKKEYENFLGQKVLTPQAVFDSKCVESMAVFKH